MWDGAGSRIILLVEGVLFAGMRWASIDRSLSAPSRVPAAAQTEVPSDVYGTSLQANAWLSPKLLYKDQPSLASRAAQAPLVRGSAAHDACQGAIIITGRLAMHSVRDWHRQRVVQAAPCLPADPWPPTSR